MPKKCRYSKYTKRLDNCRFDCNDCPIKKSIDSILTCVERDISKGEPNIWRWIK